MDGDLAAMLRALADTGWKPALYYDDGCNSKLPAPPAAWVAYPMAPVRTWASFRGPDPVGVVRSLYLHALAHPNVPPAPPDGMHEAHAARDAQERTEQASARRDLCEWCGGSGDVSSGTFGHAPCPRCVHKPDRAAYRGIDAASGGAR